MIDWGKIKRFKKSEFVDDADLASPELIKALDRGRDIVAERMYPSKAIGSLCRFGGSKTSQHYVGPGVGKVERLSTGSDMFIEGRPIKNFISLLGSGLFSGIGMYLDTNGNNGKPWVMFHLDIRQIEQPLTWIAYKVANKTKYTYPWESLYYTLLQDRRLYE